MEVYQLIRKGEMHKDFCEDFLLASELSERYSVYGVFDGCSTGIDSHVASGLLAKVVKAEMECLVIENVKSLEKLLSETVFNTMSTLRNIRNDLFMKTNELLSTMILFVVDKINNKGEVLVFGDGFVAINGQSISIEQNNTPDYLAYYLDELENFDDFEIWLTNHSKRYKVEDIVDVSLATDGVKSFQKANSTIDAMNEPVPSDFLAKDNFLLHNKSMLSRKCNILKTKHRLINQDDIALIRIRN